MRKYHSPTTLDAHRLLLVLVLRLKARIVTMYKMTMEYVIIAWSLLRSRTMEGAAGVDDDTVRFLSLLYVSLERGAEVLLSLGTRADAPASAPQYAQS